MRRGLWGLVLTMAACGGRGAAVDRAQDAVLRDPNVVAAWVALGDAHSRADNEDQAASAYGRAMSLDPDNEALRSRAGRGRSSQIRALELQVLTDPDNDELWGDLGDAFAESGDRQSALRHYRYALSIDSNDSEWQRKVLELADPADIEAMLDDVARSDNDETIGDLADRLRADGREDDACRLYERAWSIDPDDSEWVRALASCPGNDGLLDQLIADASGSGDDERIGDAGDILAEQGRHEEACALYQRALSLDPGDSEWQRNVQTCSGQTPHFDPGNGPPPPIPGFGSGLPMPAPTGPSSDSLVGLGRAALAQGDRRAALQHFEAALLDRPTDRDARVGVLSITGKTLITLLEELTTQRADDDEVWGDLGDAYLATARKADAMRAYQRAAELDGDDFEWRSKLDVLDPSRMGAP